LQKKNQKTFLTSGLGMGQRGRPTQTPEEDFSAALCAWQRPLHTPCPKVIKVFLLLFVHKKKAFHCRCYV
jgi:hypothetical protein